MERLIVIDNFLEKPIYDELLKYVGGPKFPWFYGDNVSLPLEDGNLIKDPMAMETAGLSHVMYDRGWDALSYTYDFFKPFFATMNEKLGLKESNIIRARASLKWPKIGYTKDNYSLPHVDYYYPHETLIYYVNDSDGDTFIFDQWFTFTGNGNGIAADNFTIQKRISPKANRLVWIDGLHYHTASNPIDNDKRIILNINLDKV